MSPWRQRSRPGRGPRWIKAVPWLLLLAVGLGVRLWGVTNTPLDGHHVRQTDTASMALIMCQEEIAPFFPRIHWAGPLAGTVESELPLYAALTAVVWRLTCDQCVTCSPIWPRLLSVALWLLGGVALAWWVRRRLSGPAWPALVLYALSPLAVVFSRSIQPDALGVALLLWALALADRSRDLRRPMAVLGVALAAGLLLGLAVTTAGKPVFWAPLVVLLVARGRGGWRIPAAALLLAVSGLVSAAWLIHAHSLGSQGATFGLWGVGAQKWGGPGVWLNLNSWRYIAGTLVTHTLTPAGVVFCGAGLLLTRSRQAELWPHAAGMAFGALAMVVATAGYSIHDYYQLSLIPFASVLAGAAMVEGWRRLRHRASRRTLLLLAAALCLGVFSLWLGARFVSYYLHMDQRIPVMARAAAAAMEPEVAVIVVDRHPQTVLFAMDRRGWHRDKLVLEEVRRLRKLGARYLLVTSTSPSFLDGELMSWASSRWTTEASTQYWILYKLFP